MSLLDEIRNRNNQPVVPPRQDVFQKDINPDLIEAEHEVAQATNISDRGASNASSIESFGISQVKQLEDLLASFPEIAQRFPIRLESQIKDELNLLCDKEKVTIETLLEAFYVVCKDKDALMTKVLKEAKKRLKTRKEAGNIRSSITKLNNLTRKKK